jgi:hypothetical protein
MVPTHVKAIVALTSALFLAAGGRDIVSPGAGLPLPDDDKVIQSLFGAPPVGACTASEVGCVPGRLLFLSHGWGMMVVTLALAKVVTVFSHPEGTYLRRNLFLLFGASDLAFGAIVQSHEPLFASRGASALGFVAAFAVEGLVFLHDALTRARPAKKAKK